MDGNFNFRKAKIGGFNKKDVISYIEKMRNDFFDYKTAVEATIDTLNAKINELEAVMNEHNDTVAVVTETVNPEPVPVLDPLTNINEATSHLKSVADELCRNLSDFMLKIRTAESLPEQTQADVFENTEAYIEETAKEIFEADTEAAQTEDKVNEILKASDSFSFEAAESSCASELSVAKEEHRNVLENLNNSSFFC